MITDQLIENLREIVGDAHVLVGRAGTELYSYDASLARGKPGVVAFPADTQEAAAVVQAAYRAGVAYVPRGFGTNLSGGTVLTEGIIICLSRFNRIRGIFPESRHAVVQPGVTNRVPAADNPVFNITFANQGENDEFDVNVKVGVSAAGSDAINVQKRVDQPAAQTPEITLQVPLGETPTVGTPVTVRVEIVPVPGEITTDNNSGSYTVIFER